MAKPSFSILPVQHADIPALARISGNAFDNDRHTEMKSYAQGPNHMQNHALDHYPFYLEHPRCVVLKAVEEGSGEIMGHVTWAFRGWEPGTIPIPEGSPVKHEPAKKKEEEQEEEEKKTDSEEREAEKTNEAQADAEPQEEQDSVKKLEAFTSADLENWSNDIMPEGAKCIYIIGLSVDPKFQRRGVATALLKWGTDVVDAAGAFAWVHSSEPAWPVYGKAGFEVIKTLDIDLDAWAPVPPPEGGKWGHYVFRYMVYDSDKKRLEETKKAWEGK